jgi:hypothetical protein
MRMNRRAGARQPLQAERLKAYRRDRGGTLKELLER